MDDATVRRATYLDVESEGERRATYRELHLCGSCRNAQLCRFAPEPNDALIAVSRCRLYEPQG